MEKVPTAQQSTLKEGSNSKLQYGVLIIDSWIFPEGWVLNLEACAQLMLVDPRQQNA